VYITSKRKCHHKKVPHQNHEARQSAQPHQRIEEALCPDGFASLRGLHRKHREPQHRPNEESCNGQPQRHIKAPAPIRSFCTKQVLVEEQDQRPIDVTHAGQ
jgi:hypothetical protein